MHIRRTRNLFYISFSFTSVQHVLSSETKTMFVRGTYIQTTVYFRVIVPFISIYLSERENQRGKKELFLHFIVMKKFTPVAWSLSLLAPFSQRGLPPEQRRVIRHCAVTPLEMELSYLGILHSFWVLQLRESRPQFFSWPKVLYALFYEDLFYGTR